MVKIHEKYISRCLEVGRKALGTSAPNPMVGCVIVHEDRIIGEGFTSPFGGAHAEVNAIRSVTDTDKLVDATLYVSLEPCSHHGKTPPCTDLILERGIRQIVIGIQDPHDKVAGKGIARLKNAGCTVAVSVLEQQCREHHRRFLSFHEQQRPYIILKWAESIDGYLAPEHANRTREAQPFWITTSLSRQVVHQWRSQEQAILVGAQTVIDDNPELTVRDWAGTNPVRVIWDTDGSIRGDYRIFNDQARTVILTAETGRKGPGEVITISKESVDAKQVAASLFDLHIISVLVEGGARTLKSFLEEGLWDEARVFRGPVLFGSGVEAPRVQGRLEGVKSIGADTLSIYRND